MQIKTPNESTKPKNFPIHTERMGNIRTAAGGGARRFSTLCKNISVHNNLFFDANKLTIFVEQPN